MWSSAKRHFKEQYLMKTKRRWIRQFCSHAPLREMGQVFAGERNDESWMVIKEVKIKTEMGHMYAKIWLLIRQNCIKTRGTRGEGWNFTQRKDVTPSYMITKRKKKRHKNKSESIPYNPRQRIVDRVLLHFVNR